jgi:NAD(P)-dependent dehydrogenase (short-subunit alcohol dehydrogenase family)
MQTGKLSGKVALVTGASSGIGEATALALAGEGACVAIAARRVQRLNDLADRIRQAGGDALPIEADVTEAWLTMVLSQYAENILAFKADAAQVWGRLRVPNPGHELDKQIAAVALVNDLTMVTRNIADFEDTGVKLINPSLPVADKV